MNKKGFTLIELLAVLGLLTIIALLGVPVLLNQIESQKKKNYENFVGDLCLSAEAYINHSNDIEGIESFKEPGDVLSIKMEDLIVNNYVKSNTKNPKTKEKIKATDTIIVTINENKTYDCSLNNEVITVTFDANGGELSNNTKNVVVGSSYGTLPTPTRDGYTFKGWNGKNVFDYEQILLTNSSTVTKTTFNDKQVLSWINNSTANNQKFLQGYFKLNTQYTITGNIASNTINRLAFSIVYSDGTEQVITYQNGEYPTANVFKNIKITSQQNKTIEYIKGVWSAGEIMYIDINSFQIEEGDTATKYEPYYIQKTTKVVQSNNHTLKAIWEKN